MKLRNNPDFVNHILYFCGLLLCVIPPAACTLSYFPLWIESSGDRVICGGVALLIVLAALPFYKYIKKKLESAASYVMWLLIFLFCALMSRIIDQVTVIAFVGFVSNLLGALLMKIGARDK